MQTRIENLPQFVIKYNFIVFQINFGFQQLKQLNFWSVLAGNQFELVSLKKFSNFAIDVDA